MSLRKQRSRAEDAKIKDDLHLLRIAFEEYYNDNNCYPPAEWFDGAEDCGSANFAPYMREIPCNPKTALPYNLEYDSTTCGWFKMYANLQSADTDPDVQALCVYDGSGNSEYNYCTASTNTTCTINCPTPSGSPTPTPSGSPAPSDPSSSYYYCQGTDNCTVYNSLLETCTPSYTNDPNCGWNCSTEIGNCTPL